MAYIEQSCGDDRMSNYAQHFCIATKGGQCSLDKTGRCKMCGEVKGAAPAQVQQTMGDSDVMANYSKHFCSATMGGQCSLDKTERCKRCGEKKK